MERSYITEDIPVGAMHEKSFFKETKYDLDYLGIGHMTKWQVLDYMRNGVYVEE